MPRYFLGVDGGQSSTTAVIGDEDSRVLGVGRGGPCNDLASALRSSVGAACLAAGLDPSRAAFAVARLGLSGNLEGRAAVAGNILRSDRTIITNDADIALTGATGGQPGIVVIAGTGSIAFGRNAVGRTARAGGWGYLFGDEGGAFWIAQQAIRAGLRWEEGWGIPTSLRARLLDATGAPSMNQFMHRCYTLEFSRPNVAKLAVLVNHAAEARDPAALKILEDAARELTLIIIGVRGQLFAPDEETLVAYSGGVFESRILRAKLREWMSSERGAKVIPRRYSPVMGALMEAYNSVGLRFTARRLQDSALSLCLG